MGNFPSFFWCVYQRDVARILSSCGSGLTACVIGLGLHQLGMPLTRWAVYDGSWAEWGADQEGCGEIGSISPSPAIFMSLLVDLEIKLYCCPYFIILTIIVI